MQGIDWVDSGASQVVIIKYLLSVVDIIYPWDLIGQFGVLLALRQGNHFVIIGVLVD